MSEPARIPAEEAVHASGGGVEGDEQGRMPRRRGLECHGALVAAPDHPRALVAAPDRNTANEALVVCIESGVGSIQFGASRRQSLVGGAMRRDKATGRREGLSAKAGKAALAVDGGQDCAASEWVVSVWGCSGGGQCAR